MDYFGSLSRMSFASFAALVLGYLSMTCWQRSRALSGCVWTNSLAPASSFSAASSAEADEDDEASGGGVPATFGGAAAGGLSRAVTASSKNWAGGALWPIPGASTYAVFRKPSF